MSKRGVEFLKFSLEEMLPHIEKYTVPQYGDAPDDNVETWTAADCVRAIEKYVKRFGKNAREGQEHLDMMKIAHFAQLAANKIRRGVG